MNRTKQTEEKMIGAVKQMKAGRGAIGPTAVSITAPRAHSQICSASPVSAVLTGARSLKRRLLAPDPHPALRFRRGKIKIRFSKFRLVEKTRSGQ